MARAAATGRLSREGGRTAQSAFWRAVGVVAGGAAFGQTLSLLAAPVLTRLYLPAQYGAYALYLSLTTLLVVVCTARYELAIPLPDDDVEATEVLAFALTVTVAVSALLGVGVALGADELLAATPAAALAPYLWLVPVALLAAGTYQSMVYWAMRQQAFGVVARTRMLQGVGKTGAQLVLGAFGAGALGLMLGDALGRGSGGGRLARALSRRNREALRAVRWTGVARQARRYARFAGMSSSSALLEIGAMQLAPLMLSIYFTIDVVGQYGLAQQVIFLPIALLAQSVSHVYASEAPRAAREGAASLRHVYLKTAGGLALIAAAPALALALLAPPAFSFVFGEQWAEAGEYARLMAPVFFFFIVVWPLTYTLNVLGALNLLLAWSGARFAAALLALAVVPALGGDARQSVLAYSLALSAAFVALFLLCLSQIDAGAGAAAEPSETRASRLGSDG